MLSQEASILVVDDEVDTCRNLSDILTDLGYHVEMAHDGKAALEKVRHKRYDVALLDLKMPGMDGLTLYREIKKVRAGTVAIVVTAYASSSTASEALAAGAWQIVAKPIDFPKLLALVEEALDQPLVLVVDDDPDLCANLWDLLRKHGYRVCLAHDEKEAAERLAGSGFRVVLIDMKLPQGDGATVFGLVRQTNPKARTIMITGKRTETEQLIQKVVNEGADAVCYKPFDVPNLLTVLQKLTKKAAIHERQVVRGSLMAEVSSMYVLVVDDDPDTRANLRDILELDDYRVETAGTIAEALARDNWSEITAILLDRKLPDGTSEQVLPRLKELAPHADILIVTGHADIEGAVAALRQGAADYILKPINADAIRASLFRLAQRQKLARELEQAQERALQSERLAAIGQMVTGLAHESGNALARSQACLEMLGWEVSDRPEALELIARIQKAQDHLRQLYEEVRGYAAPVKLAQEDWDLSCVWRQAWENLSLKRREKETSLHEESRGINLHCLADYFRLEQVFRNIFENSLAACGHHVDIAILAAEASLGGRPALRLAIRDNGPGLTPEQRRRIFEPFFTTKTKGTGLGMAITKRIIEAHGGQLEVGDSNCQGAEIVITLPREGT